MLSAADGHACATLNPQLEFGVLPRRAADLYNRTSAEHSRRACTSYADTPCWNMGSFLGVPLTCSK